jgi:hypothetical protein
MQDPNVKRLIAHKMALIMVPPGGGIGSAVSALTTPGRVVEVAKGVGGAGDRGGEDRAG